VRSALPFAWAGLLRAPWRTLLRVTVLAAAVSLLGAMLIFVGHSLRTMAASAIRSVPLDWQGPVPSGGRDLAIARAVARQPGVRAAAAVATAPIVGSEHIAPTGVVQAGAGAVLAVPPDYERQFHTFRMLRGALRPGGVVLDQQLAATLQAGVGDLVRLRARRGAPARPFRVTGVALVASPDVLFQPLDPQLGPAPAQPPADVAVMPFGTFARSLALDLRSVRQAGVASPVVPGSQAGIQWQVQAQVDPGALGDTPAQALTRAQQLRNAVQRTLPGQVQFVDNLSDGLTTSAGDALYAQALFILLAVPGALVALGLAYLAALGTAERDRREMALLRVRGARRRMLLGIAAWESLMLGLVAGLLGAGGALVAVNALISGGLGLTTWRLLVAVLACVALAVAGAGAARLAAGAGASRGPVAAARAPALGVRPLWERLYLDLIALAGAGLIFWLTARTGFSAVINPDSNPTLSLAVYMFFAPALLWVGATLLLVRLRGRGLSWATRAAVGGRATTLAGFLFVSAGRRGAAINRGLVVVGLLLAFGVSLGLFSATYDEQSRVDAQLTLGADVVATAGPGVVTNHHVASDIARVPGVTATATVDHEYAYVGPDLQDIYGIEPATLTRATTLRDSYFLGGSATSLMTALASRRDGLLVSKETITDYSLRPGDLVRLRVLDRRTGKLRVAPFHVVGVVQEFPSAPKDSFMVANLRYLDAVTHGAGPNVVFARTAGADPSQVARLVAQRTRRDGTQVHDIRAQTAQTVSSITTVDLSGIARIEEAFAVALAAGAMALFVALGVAERRQELATMAAVGAPLRAIAAFVWAEAALVLVAGLALAAGLGWLLAEMLVVMLQHVFDPPPDGLTVPWGFLGALAAGAVGGGLLACAVAAQRLRRLPLGTILRER
jgi:putative ABC transport system permease protein